MILCLQINLVAHLMGLWVWDDNEGPCGQLLGKFIDFFFNITLFCSALSWGVSIGLQG